MDVAGKALPTAESLAATADRGFDATELHLPDGALDDLDATVDVVDDADIAVESVHTPHVTHEALDRIERADALARRLDATLVVHSQYLGHVHTSRLAALDLRSRHAFENNPGASVRHLEAQVLDAGHDLVLDVAHLYTAHGDYLERVEALLSAYGDRIPVVHLADATLTADGLPFGDGEMDLAATTRLLADGLPGDATVVLEVMPNRQVEARERVEAYLADA
jgi:sugar phosphate isomerase/epimerase